MPFLSICSAGTHDINILSASCILRYVTVDHISRGKLELLNRNYEQVIVRNNRWEENELGESLLVSSYCFRIIESYMILGSCLLESRGR